jgi:hypothetical protein
MEPGSMRGEAGATRDTGACVDRDVKARVPRGSASSQSAAASQWLSTAVRPKASTAAIHRPRSDSLSCPTA